MLARDLSATPSLSMWPSAAQGNEAAAKLLQALVALEEQNPLSTMPFDADMLPLIQPGLARRAASLGSKSPAGSMRVGSMGARSVQEVAARRSAALTPGARSAATSAPSARPAPGTNRTATFDRVTGAGQRDQMVSGRITVNGHSYEFRSGGHGNGNLPAGRYTVTPHLWNRDTAGMTVGGVGYSFALNDAFDARTGRNRSELRIHPDGGTAGTQGCIGIVGDAATQRRFREDMRAELQRSGGSFTLNVG